MVTVDTTHVVMVTVDTHVMVIVDTLLMLWLQVTAYSEGLFIFFSIGSMKGRRKERERGTDSYGTTTCQYFGKEGVGTADACHFN